MNQSHQFSIIFSWSHVFLLCIPRLVSWHLKFDTFNTFLALRPAVHPARLVQMLTWLSKVRDKRLHLHDKVNKIYSKTNQGIYKELWGTDLNGVSDTMWKNSKGLYAFLRMILGAPKMAALGRLRARCAQCIVVETAPLSVHILWWISEATKILEHALPSENPNNN